MSLGHAISFLTILYTLFIYLLFYFLKFSHTVALYYFRLPARLGSQISEPLAVL